MQRAERGGLRGLEDAGVAGGKGGGELPCGHEEREIPRDDLAGDAERTSPAAGESVVELVRPAGVVEEMRGDEGQVDVAAFLDRLAAVHRLEHGEFPGLLLEQAGDAVEIFRALAAGHFPPDGFLRPAGGLHRAVDVGGAGGGDVGELLFVRGIDRGEGPARLGESAVDEEAVGGVELDRRGLRRGRVGPFAETEMALAGGDGQLVGGGVRVDGHDGPGLGADGGNGAFDFHRWGMECLVVPQGREK